MSPSKPHNRIALVTGAGRGIGRACALALLADGWRVVFTGRRADALQSAIAEAGDPFGDIASRAVAVTADVGQPDSVATLFDAVRSRFGRLDLLFNNAGISSPAVPLEDLPFDEWQAALSANLTGAFLCTQQAFRMMKAQSPRGGRIINNGSISAHVPRPCATPYAATKHAITGLTRSAALDGRAFDIAVGQIDIGNVATDMTAKMVSGVLQPDGSHKPEARMAMAAVTSTFLAMANLPLDANVLTMTVMATQMPYVGRG
jgi:NAD(P)-dependent dehydrogenase (short-subunit alcohol dehydrogenase family)